MDELDGRFEAFERRFAELETKVLFVGLDKLQKSLNARFDSLERRFDKMEMLITESLGSPGVIPDRSTVASLPELEKIPLLPIAPTRQLPVAQVRPVDLSPRPVGMIRSDSAPPSLAPLPLKSPRSPRGAAPSPRSGAIEKVTALELTTVSNVPLPRARPAGVAAVQKITDTVVTESSLEKVATAFELISPFLGKMNMISDPFGITDLVLGVLKVVVAVIERVRQNRQKLVELSCSSTHPSKELSSLRFRWMLFSITF